MNDDEVRGAYLRLADPFGTPLRSILLFLSLALVGVYSLLRLQGNHRLAMIALTLVAVAAYEFVSRRARRAAADLPADETRARFLAKARGALRAAPLLPVRGFLWGTLGAWSGAAAAGAVRFPLFELQELQVFFAGAGLLFAARYFLEWRVDVPRIRAEVASMDAAAAAAATRDG